MEKSIKQLKKLGDKQFYDDVKKFIISSHNFYESKIPELKVLAIRLNEEYSLKEFYPIFNKLWNSHIGKEASLAIYTLQLYKKDFDLQTWDFIRRKIKDIKSFDKIDSIGINIIGEIMLKYPQIKKEIIKYSSSKNIWFKRLSVISTIPLVRSGEFDTALIIINKHLFDKGDYMQKAIGMLLKEMGDKKPEFLKRFILKNVNMPITIFFYATENQKELRNLREYKNPLNKRIENLFFWK